MKKILLSFIIFSILSFFSKAYCFDLKVNGIYRDSSCRISVSIVNSGDEKIPLEDFLNLRLEVEGYLFCEDKEPKRFSDTIVKFSSFLKLPKYKTTISTDIYLDTSGNCSGYATATFYSGAKILKDDNIENNSYRKDFNTSCEIIVF
jgi:hypothetical protein